MAAVLRHGFGIQKGRAPMLLYFLRHGQTDWNKDHRVMGHTPVPLNETGRAGMTALARALKSEELRVVYTSTVARALESASILADEWGAALREEPRLNEAEFEEWIGKTYADLRDDEQFRLYLSTPTRAHFSGKEGIVDIQKRALAAVDRILGEAKTGKAAVVSHSDIIKPVLTHWLGMDLDAMHRLSIENASVTLVDCSGAAPRIRFINVVPMRWIRTP
jgi:broad specificity phosphatase PhoE